MDLTIQNTSKVMQGDLMEFSGALTSLNTDLTGLSINTGKHTWQLTMNMMCVDIIGI